MDNLEAFRKQLVADRHAKYRAEADRAHHSFSPGARTLWGLSVRRKAVRGRAVTVQRRRYQVSSPNPPTSR